MNPSIQFILKFQSIVGIIYCIICLNFDFKKNEILRSVFIFFSRMVEMSKENTQATTNR